MGVTLSSFLLRFPQQSFPLFTFPTLLCAQFIDLPWWSRPGDGHSPKNLLSSGVLTRCSDFPSPGSTSLQSRSPRSPWGGCTSARPQPTTCGRKANPTQTRGEEHRCLLQAVLGTQGLWMCQSPGWGGWLEGGGKWGTRPELAVFACVEERRCPLWPQEGSPRLCEGLGTAPVPRSRRRGDVPSPP